MSTEDAARTLLIVSKQLKLAGEGEMRKQLHRDLREVVKPLLPEIRRSAGERFPSRGGLARHMSRAGRYRTKLSTGSKTVGVSIRANRTDPRTDSQGRIAHPVPNRDGSPKRNAAGLRVTAVQRFPTAIGYFSTPVTSRGPELQQQLVKRLAWWSSRLVKG